MSLIDEALKRARQEAARQQDAEREARYAKVPVFVPPPRPARSWRLPAVVAVCLAVGVAGGVMWRTPSPGPSPVRPTTPRPERERGTPAEVVATAEPPVVVEEQPKAPSTPTPAPVMEERPEPRSPSPGEGARGDGRGGQGERVEPPAPVVIPTLPPVPPDPGPVIALPQPSPTPPPPPPAEPQSYVREVPLPGGGTLRLNGIAYSAQQPVALFGDKVVAPGESIEGFTVIAIEAQRVKLQGPGGVVYVTLK